MNKNYINGRAKEYRIMNKLKAEGWSIVIRSAGSHSPVDITAIKKIKDGSIKVRFIQCKPKKYNANKLCAEYDWLNCCEAVTTFEVV